MNKKAVMDGGLAVGLCSALGLMVGVVAMQGLPLEAVAFGMVLLPFLPVPVALMTARHGFMTGALMAIVIGSLCTSLVVATGSSAGLLVFLFAGVAGVFAGAGFRAGKGVYRMLVMLMLLFTGLILIWFGTYSLAAGVGPVAAIEDFTASLARESSGLYQSLGIAEGSQDEIASQVSENALYSMPALLLLVGAMASIVTVSFSRFVFRAVKQPFPQDIVFSELRLHFGFVYMFIASLLLLLVAYFLEGTAATWAEAAGQNLMILSTALFFFQGLAIAAWFLRRRRASGIMKAAVYVILVMLEWLLQLVSFLGIFDVFIDFRRRFGQKEGPSRGGQGK